MVRAAGHALALLPAPRRIVTRPGWVRLLAQPCPHRAQPRQQRDLPRLTTRTPGITARSPSKSRNLSEAPGRNASVHLPSQVNGTKQ